MHTFQGGERDVVVFSLVAGEGMSPGAVSWIHRQLNLWNVAITRARTHLIVVGDRNLWAKRGGIVATLLDAATGGGAHPREDAADELLKRLYRRLSRQPGATVVLGEGVNGHAADALVRDSDSGTHSAVLLDPGPDENSDPARHLRLMLHRTRLMDGGDQGGEALRYPAWWLYETNDG